MCLFWFSWEGCSGSFFTGIHSPARPVKTHWVCASKVLSPRRTGDLIETLLRASWRTRVVYGGHEIVGGFVCLTVWRLRLLACTVPTQAIYNTRRTQDCRKNNVRGRARVAMHVDLFRNHAYLPYAATVPRSHRIVRPTTQAIIFRKPVVFFLTKSVLCRAHRYSSGAGSAKAGLTIQ